MILPSRMTILRHAHSEKNEAEKLQRQGRFEEIPAELLEKADWEARISAERGVGQAQLAGQWIAENIGPVASYFKEHYVSPKIRTRETAVYVGGADCTWKLENSLMERNRGTYVGVPFSERETTFPHTSAALEKAPFFTQYDNGESIAYQAVFRAKWFLERASREAPKQPIIAVGHGEINLALRYEIEGMLPEEWQALDKGKVGGIRNCAILDYSSIDPKRPNSAAADRPHWMRIIYPDNLHESPNDGQWQEFDPEREFSGTDLMKTVEAYSRHLDVDLAAAMPLGQVVDLKHTA